MNMHENWDCYDNEEEEQQSTPLPHPFFEPEAYDPQESEQQDEDGDGGEEESDEGEEQPVPSEDEQQQPSLSPSTECHHHRDDGTHSFIFDDVSQMMEHSDRSKLTEFDKDFIGMDFESYKDAANQYESLWQEGIDKLEECVDELKDAALPELKDHRRRVRFNDDDGDEIDYDRLRNGQEFWRTSARQEVSGPTEVTIIVDMTTSFYKKSDDILWRGAAAIALAEEMESKGYTTELWMVDKGAKFFSAVNLKRGVDTLDRSSIVNAVSGWFYRSLYFAHLWTVRDMELPGVDPDRVGIPTQKDLDEIAYGARRILVSSVFSKDGAISLVQSELENVVSHKDSEVDSHAN